MYPFVACLWSEPVCPFLCRTLSAVRELPQVFAQSTRMKVDLTTAIRFVNALCSAAWRVMFQIRLSRLVLNPSTLLIIFVLTSTLSTLLGGLLTQEP